MKRSLSPKIIIAALVALSVILLTSCLWPKIQNASPTPADPQPPITSDTSANLETTEPTAETSTPETPTETPEETPSPAPSAQKPSAATQHLSDNCTLKNAQLLLINPNFTVSTDFIAARRAELIDLTDNYGIVEGNAWNGRPLLDPEAAIHLNNLVKAYQAAYPSHTLETRSCFRSVGTNCGRLCYATGTSDHHSGYTCDLLDPAYGTELNTDHYAAHLEWQWLKANAHKYGFIDRFPAAWAGGPMSAPVNLTADGSTGLYETWHYRYVGLTAASEIASGKYNNGAYDSLEHYLLSRGLVSDLLHPSCP